jgi:SAM-dependent methyltransferase
VRRLLERAIELAAAARAPKEPPAPLGPELGDEALLERPRCPGCGHTRATVVLAAEDTWVPERPDAELGPRRFSVVRCAICALRYTTPRFKQAHRALAFAGDYPFYLRARTARRTGDASIDLDAARAPFLARAARLEAARPRPGRLLDLGGGDGFFAEVMRARGWDAELFDLDPDVVWFAHERLGIPAQRGDLEADAWPAGPFEAITMWGVLQLLYEPRRALERARAALAPGGVLAIGVSNFEGAGARLFGPRWRGLGLPRHLTHFTPGTLTRLLDFCGFEVVAMARETPRWIVAGSVDALPLGAGARRAVKGGLLAAGRVLGPTALGDTLEVYARVSVRPDRPAGRG